ncbi:30S ribosomal protein S1 [Aerococcus kribbianus]|uniref:30S ribosomal protein S1 n=1 Tax=Aerococcus kribbianus TaxID=2999064 RepID=A0A9X3FNP9_9LACT|nr:MULTISPECIES: 30S ribosomal protein S1 [unclassified Aerococcus]MCZ0717654.1 30S ribosomal protein S1 [Aerococcus sp. YH-aer221]MCZ0725942.1 30S ribosomal protein S1 [Aerococcus sp. YH-aer222]
MANELEQQNNNEVEANEEIPSMEDLFAESMEVKIGDTVKGEVLTIDDDKQVIVGIEGAGVEGVVPYNEISAQPFEEITDVLNVGDVVDLVVVKQIKEKENGSFLLSKRRVEAKKVWAELEEKAANDETITVPVTRVVKGGLVVDAGIRGFIPASMVEDYYVDDFSPYQGQELEVKIVEIDPKENRLILSHKEIAAEKRKQERAEKLASFEEGSVVTGKVARLANFGAFIDLGGIDGLVHISQIAHHHVKHPSDVLTEGEDVDVKILSVDEENGRISLSIKELQAGPWDDIEEKAPKGAELDGIVRRLVDFGAFVEVFPGVEGLVHISQIAHEHVATPADKLSEGQEIKVKVLDVNPEEQRLSLSIKALEEAPAQSQDQSGSRSEAKKRSTGGQKKSRPKNNARQNKQNVSDDDTGFTMSDILGDQLKGFSFDDED